MPFPRTKLVLLIAVAVALAACQIDGSSQSRQWKEASPATYEVATVRDGQNREIQVAVIHVGFLEESRVSPILGRRLFTRELTAKDAATAMISYAHWQEAYSGDRAILGKTVFLNGEPFTMVGLMPQGFEFPSRTKLWLSRRAAP